MGLDYDTSKKVALKTILLLALITIGEVLFCLAGKGYLIEGVHFPSAVIIIVMVTMSLVKAYYIIFEFMHLKYEVPGMAKTILLPTVLLVWAIIAFLAEGTSWYNMRTRYERVEEGKTEIPARKLIGIIDVNLSITKQL